MELIKALYKTNWRGVPLWELVAEGQFALQELEEAKGQVREGLIYTLEDIQGELERRENLKQFDKGLAGRQLILAIKEKAPLPDVIEKYTEVFYGKSGNQKQCRFRCTLHGDDNHPSGVIYTEEKRWWCFGCNKGGDIFDFIMAWERIDFIEAVRRLGHLYGFDMQFPKRKDAPYKGYEL